MLCRIFGNDTIDRHVQFQNAIHRIALCIPSGVAPINEPTNQRKGGKSETHILVRPGTFLDTLHCQQPIAQSGIPLEYPKHSVHGSHGLLDQGVLGKHITKNKLKTMSSTT